MGTNKNMSNKKMLNRILLFGVLGQDPRIANEELSEIILMTPSLTDVDDALLSGELIRISFSGKLAEFVGENLKMGDKIFIRGRIVQNKIVPKKRHFIELFHNKKTTQDIIREETQYIICEEIGFLNGPGYNYNCRYGE